VYVTRGACKNFQVSSVTHSIIIEAGGSIIFYLHIHRIAGAVGGRCGGGGLPVAPIF
jgi:hypothetical protein